RQYCQLELAALWCERTSVPATLDAKLLRKIVVLIVALRASGHIGLDLRLSDIGQLKYRSRWYLLLREGESEQSGVPGLQQYFAGRKLAKYRHQNRLRLVTNSE